jgi:general secretion pathway protein M
MSAMREAWERRSEGERRVLAAIALLVAAALLLAFVWLPLERTRTRLTAELPLLRASVASLEEQAGVVRRLRTMPARTTSGTTPLGAISNANLPGAQVTALDDRRVRVVGADVAFGALLDWLATVQSSHGLRVESARLEALPTAGRVRAELVLARG